MSYRDARGVTLIELLIAMTIVAILAALAYPSYREHVRRSNRAAAQSFLMDVSLRQQQRFLDVRSYAASLDTLGMTAPEEVARHYTVAIALTAGPPPGFTVSAAPSGAQIGDACATLQIDQGGTRSPAGCW